MTLEEKYQDALLALEAMVAQYLEYGGKLDHMYMSAGESAMEVLEREGYVRQIEGRLWEFTDKSFYNGYSS